MFRKHLCGWLAALLLLGSLTACAGETDIPTDTNQGQATSSDAVEESDTRKQLDIPDTFYDGEELCFLTRDEGEWSNIEIFTEKLTSDTDNQSSAVYERNDRIKNEYGVIIKELKMETTSHSAAATNEVAAPSGDFQVISSNTVQVIGLSTQGALWDLNGPSINYLNFDNPWWDGGLADGLSISDRLYLATGDILTLDNDATFVILFNKQIAAECQLPDLYDEVANKTWTMDKFWEYEQVAKQDNDGNGKMDYKTDICGFAYTIDTYNAFAFAAGLKASVKNEDDYPEYALDIERAQNVAEMGKLLFSSEYTIDMYTVSMQEGVGLYELGRTVMGEGHALFFSEVMQSVTRLRGYDVDFGILPYPMYDQNQNSYGSMMHITAGVIGIPKSVVGDTLDMTTSMLEAMAYYAVDTITTQYYEINLKTKGAKDDKSGPMMDLILANRTYDLSYYYGFGGGINSVGAALNPTSTAGVASQAKKFKRTFENGVNNLIKKMDKFLE